MGKLSELPNIGRVLENELIQAGIKDADDLKRQGSRNAFLSIRKIDDTACFSKLCALEGAVRGIRWHDLTADTKKELKNFFDGVAK